MPWIFAKRVAQLALVALGLAVIAETVVLGTVEYGRRGAEFVGCFAYDAMLLGFVCQGFPGSGLVGAWRNWPLWLFYLPGIAFLSVKLAGLAALAWLPIILYVVSARVLARNSGTCRNRR